MADNNSGVHHGGGWRYNPRDVPGLIFKPDIYALLEEAALDERRRLNASAEAEEARRRRDPKHVLIKKHKNAP